MDERPDLLSEAVGDAAVLGTVDLGGGDAVVVTRGTTHVYRSDGLLKDESIEQFDHDIDRLSIRTKRNKSSITLARLDGEESFTVPAKVLDQILEAMVEGVLLTNDVLAADEDVLAMFRFSELTLVVTDRRLFKHVGGAVWDGDFEVIAYADLSGLDFERGDFGTQVILETNDRRQRVKVPNEHAGTVRREIQDVVCDFHGVASMAELEEKLEESAEDASESSVAPADNGVETTTDPEERSDPEPDAEDSFVSAGWSPATGQGDSIDASGGGTSPSQHSATREDSNRIPDDEREPQNPELDALSDRVDALAERIDRQTELIESQQELIEQLVDELRRGR
jgi:hypothetical protein